MALPDRAQPLPQPHAAAAARSAATRSTTVRTRTAPAPRSTPSAGRTCATWSSNIRDLPEAQRSALLMRELEALLLQRDRGLAGDDRARRSSRCWSAPASRSPRPARPASSTCDEVRFELAAAAEGMGKASGPARHHARRCPECTRYRKHLRSTSRGLAALAPVGPLLLLKKLPRRPSCASGGWRRRRRRDRGRRLDRRQRGLRAPGGTAAAGAVAAGAGVAGGAGHRGLQGRRRARRSPPSSSAGGALDRRRPRAACARTRSWPPPPPVAGRLARERRPAADASPARGRRGHCLASPPETPADARARRPRARALAARRPALLTPEQLPRLRALFARDRAAARAWWERFTTHHGAGDGGARAPAVAPAPAPRHRPAAGPARAPRPPPEPEPDRPSPSRSPTRSPSQSRSPSRSPSGRARPEPEPTT